MMRHRPDLCVGGRRREARPPFRQLGFSTLIDRRSNRTHVHLTDILDRISDATARLRARAPTGCRARRPRPGPGRTTGMTSSRMAIPATITGARAGSRPRVSRRLRQREYRQPVQQSPAGGRRSGRGPRSASASYSLESQVDRGALRRRAGDGDRVRSRAGASGSVDVRAQRGELVAGGRVRVQVALAVADDADLGRRRGTSPRRGAEHELGRAAADVDHEHRRRRRRARASRPRRSAAPPRRR